MSGLYYDKYTKQHEPVPNEKKVETIYSEHYNDTNWIIEKAIEKYLQGEPGSFYCDKTGNVEYYYGGVLIGTHSDTVG